MTKFEIPNYPPTHTLYDFELLHDLQEPTSSLGLGSYSTVKLAREKRSGRLVALKLVIISFLSKFVLTFFLYRSKLG